MMDKDSNDDTQDPPEKCRLCGEEFRSTILTSVCPTCYTDTEEQQSWSPVW